MSKSATTVCVRRGGSELTNGNLDTIVGEQDDLTGWGRHIICCIENFWEVFVFRFEVVSVGRGRCCSLLVEVGREGLISNDGCALACLPALSEWFRE